MFRKRRHKTPSPEAKIFNGLKSRYLVITLRMIGTLGTIISVATLGFWFFTGQFFSIKEISCQKDSFTCPQDIAAMFEKTKGNNIFLFKIKALIEEMEKTHPEFKKVTIDKQLPNKLKVSIASRVAFLFLETPDHKKVSIDDSGFVLGEATVSQAKPLIRVDSLPAIGEKIPDNYLLKGIDLARLMQVSYLNFEYIWFPDENSYSIFFPGGVIATVSAQKDIVPQVDSLQYILSHSRMKDEAVKTIDLRFQKPIVTFGP